MSALSKSLLLFALNWIDAQLTLVWVRLGVASEGNGLMAWVMEAGDGHFLAVKLAVGALSAYALYRWSHLPLARRGLHFALGLYLALMLIHAAAGAAALGYSAPHALVSYVSSLPAGLLAFVA